MQTLLQLRLKQIAVHGNSATATKLQTARTISLSGAVKGSASFDGTKNVTINTSQDNIAILTGSITLPAYSTPESNASTNINYPTGFNFSNSHILGLSFSNGSFKSNSTNHQKPKLVDAQRAMFPGCVTLRENDIMLNIYNPIEGLTTASNVSYEIIFYKK